MDKDAAALVLQARHRQCVEELFDDYAEDFDEHLTSLGYEVPQLLLTLLPQRRFKRCIDLGCGTGLTGRSIRSSCDVMEGVDLSSRMVEKAIEREVYDAVHCADLVAFLRRQKAESCDLLVATDVVMYLYSILPFLQEARRVLELGGVLIFSTESMSEAEASNAGSLGTIERASERFAHSRTYLLSSAEGFDLIEAKEVNIRRDGDAGTVVGDILVLSKVDTLQPPVASPVRSRAQDDWRSNVW
eukprot:symbB.v1.2.006072.t1/scaffold332.1/size322744/7